MRYGIFGDVHGHLAALEQALSLLEAEGAETYLCTGDIVGPLGDSAACVKLVQKRCTATVAGNYDHMACGALKSDTMSPIAQDFQKAYTASLSLEQLAWLQKLPLVIRFEEFALTHGSMDSPEVFHYITTAQDVKACFARMDLPLVFFGHTHIPLAFFDNRPMTFQLAGAETKFDLSPCHKTIVNVGSVGQPRGEKEVSSCVLYDSDAQRVRFLHFPTPKAEPFRFK